VDFWGDPNVPDRVTYIDRLVHDPEAYGKMLQIERDPVPLDSAPLEVIRTRIGQTRARKSKEQMPATLGMRQLFRLNDTKEPRKDFQGLGVILLATVGDHA
jgi:hypothetical protein